MRDYADDIAYSALLGVQVRLGALPDTRTELHRIPPNAFNTRDGFELRLKGKYEGSVYIDALQDRDPIIRCNDGELESAIRRLLE